MIDYPQKFDYDLRVQLCTRLHKERTSLMARNLGLRARGTCLIMLPMSSILTRLLAFDFSLLALVVVLEAH